MDFSTALQIHLELISQLVSSLSDSVETTPMKIRGILSSAQIRAISETNVHQI